MENNNDNFDALWNELKEQVREAREQRSARAYLFEQVRTEAGTAVNIGDGCEDGALVSIERTGFRATALCAPGELRTIAVQCLAAAEEVEEAINAANTVAP